MRSPPIGKFSSERCVWAPQYRSAGTSTAPRVPVSVRVVRIGKLLDRGTLAPEDGDKLDVGRPQELNNRRDPIEEIGRAHVGTPVTNAHLVCRVMLEKKKIRNINQ